MGYKNINIKQDFIPLCFLFILGIISTYNLENYMDILFWDEARYLDRGLWLWHAYPKNGSPIYSVWYKLLSLFEDNRIALYYLNYKILTIASVLLAYLFLVVYKTPKSFAFFLSVMWLYSSTNLPVWPKVSHFAICIFFISSIISSFLSSNINKLIVFSVAFLLSSFARPELYVAFILFFLITIFYIIKERNVLIKSNYIFLALFFILFVIIYFLYKTPFTSGDTSRGSFAFVQHFAYNYAIWTKQDIVFWYEWPAILQKCFKPPYNFKTIILNTDSYFWKHILFNIQELIKQILLLLTSIFLPIAFIKKKIILFLCSIFTLLFFILKNKPNLTNAIKKMKINNICFTFLLVSIVPVLMSSIYAHPRAHYMVMLFPFLLFSITLFFNDKREKNPFLIIFILFLIFLWTAPKAKDFKYFDMFGKNDGLMNKTNIEFIEKKYKLDTIKILDIEGGMSTMMTQNFMSINCNQIFQDSSLYFSDIIIDKKPDIIYVTPTLLKVKKIQTDTIFQKMLLNPDEYHYTKQKTSTFDAYLLINNQKK